MTTPLEAMLHNATAILMARDAAQSAVERRKAAHDPDDLYWYADLYCAELLVVLLDAEMERRKVAAEVSDG